MDSSLDPVWGIPKGPGDHQTLGVWINQMATKAGHTRVLYASQSERTHSSPSHSDKENSYILHSGKFKFRLESLIIH
jgi:hypothetical protein